MLLLTRFHFARPVTLSELGPVLVELPPGPWVVESLLLLRITARASVGGVHELPKLPDKVTPRILRGKLKLSCCKIP